MSSAQPVQQQVQQPAPPSWSGDVFSSSVQEYAVRPFAGRTPPPTDFEMVRSLLAAHTDYAPSFRSSDIFDEAKDPSNARRLPPDQWLQQVRDLYDPGVVQSTTKVIHGRMLIIGLSLVDGTLARHLSMPFLYALADEIKINDSIAIESLLNDEGRRKWQDLPSVLQRTQVADAVRFLRDDPAVIDQLGRRDYATYLAKQISKVRSDFNQEALDSTRHKRPPPDGVFRVLIHGPWGSGKTSILNFMADELKRADGSIDQPWIVVYFNAWQYQRMRPPWWSLMNKIYQDAATQLSSGGPGVRDGWRALYLRLREQMWRFMKGRAPSVVAIVLLVGLLLLLLWWAPAIWPGVFSNNDAIKQIGTVLTVVGALWGIVTGFSRSLLLGSPAAAQSFVETTRDPMKAIEDHFCDMIDRIGHPLAVFIDDLDRCQSDYAVELLEGIQTLFLRAPVTYVIAADRQWLDACFEKGYNDFKDTISDPWQTLGQLFLEKTFQLTTWVPSIPQQQVDSYLQNLTGPEQREESHLDDAGITRAYEDSGSTEEIAGTALQLLNQTADPLRQQAIKRAALVKMATPAIEAHTEHVLRPFAPLLEPNPRSMKRLINSFGIQRVITVITVVDISDEHLAQLIILTSRWPRLAEYLLSHPGEVIAFSQMQVPPQAPPGMDDSLWKSLQDPAVYQSISKVVTGTRTAPNGQLIVSPLTDHDIREYEKLYVRQLGR